MSKKIKTKRKKAKTRRKVRLFKRRVNKKKIRNRKPPNKKRGPAFKGKASKPQEGGSVLESLFGPSPNFLFIQFFFRNEPESFGLKTIADKTSLTRDIINREAAYLVKVGMLNKRGSGSNKHYQLNSSFPFLNEFNSLILRSSPVGKARLINIIKRAGKLRLVLISGVFLNKGDSQIDLFVVGDKLNERKLEAVARELEILVGKELRWAGMETNEFLYRWRMFDRFVRDVLASQHEKVLVHNLPLT